MSSRTKDESVFGTGGLPFIIGATVAFGGGIALYYRSCLKQALIALEKYPSLMLLHLDSNYPTKRWSMSSFGREGQWMGSQKHACHQLAERWAGARCE